MPRISRRGGTCRSWRLRRPPTLTSEVPRSTIPAPQDTKTRSSRPVHRRILGSPPRALPWPDFPSAPRGQLQKQRMPHQLAGQQLRDLTPEEIAAASVEPLGRTSGAAPLAAAPVGVIFCLVRPAHPCAPRPRASLAGGKAHVVLGPKKPVARTPRECAAPSKL
jgi:hypothetical protein